MCTRPGESLTAARVGDAIGRRHDSRVAENAGPGVFAHRAQGKRFPFTAAWLNGSRRISSISACWPASLQAKQYDEAIAAYRDLIRKDKTRLRAYSQNLLSIYLLDLKDEAVRAAEELPGPRLPIRNAPQPGRLYNTYGAPGTRCAVPERHPPEAGRRATEQYGEALAAAGRWGERRKFSANHGSRERTIPPPNAAPPGSDHAAAGSCGGPDPRLRADLRHAETGARLPGPCGGMHGGGRQRAIRSWKTA